jgi:hypothetical protein
MRWHPDKFLSKFGARLVAGQSQQVQDKVKHISKILTGLNDGMTKP